MKILILILSSISVAACTLEVNSKELSRKEFNYRQNVRVVAGFYKGLEGRVEESLLSYSNCYRQYLVWLDGPGFVKICNDELEAVK